MRCTIIKAGRICSNFFHQLHITEIFSCNIFIYVLQNLIIRIFLRIVCHMNCYICLHAVCCHRHCCIASIKTFFDTGRCFILDRIRISYISIPISRRIFYPHDTTIIYGNIISIRYCIADISSVCMDLIFRIHIRRNRDHPIIAA